MAKEIGPEFSCGSTNMVVSRKYIILNFNLFLETAPGVLWSKKWASKCRRILYLVRAESKREKTNLIKGAYLILECNRMMGIPQIISYFWKYLYFFGKTIGNKNTVFSFSIRCLIRLKTQDKHIVLTIKRRKVITISEETTYIIRRNALFVSLSFFWICWFGAQILSYSHKPPNSRIGFLDS